jgi:hypothetical protein
MADPTGESNGEAPRLEFDHRRMLRFHGSVITSDGGLLTYRGLDDVFALTTAGGERLAEARTGKNRRDLSWSDCCDRRYSAGSPGTRT